METEVVALYCRAADRRSRSVPEETDALPVMDASVDWNRKQPAMYTPVCGLSASMFGALPMDAASA